MVHLTFVTEFNAVHRLWKAGLGEAENIERFGVCANRHGHRFRLEITVGGEVSAKFPVIVERAVIQRTIDDVLLPRLHNRDLGDFLGGNGRIATGEQTCRSIWRLLEPEFVAPVALLRVRLVETSKNSFVCCGE